jgi:hypothetical protein
MPPALLLRVAIRHRPKFARHYTADLLNGISHRNRNTIVISGDSITLSELSHTGESKEIDHAEISRNFAGHRRKRRSPLRHVRQVGMAVEL